jgi:hypothetical protein
MPRQTVHIPLSSLPPYEAAAEFFSYIAFANPNEAIQRYEYRIALSRSAIMIRATVERNWGEAIHAIRPLLFSRPERLFQSILAEGNDRLCRRIICAMPIIMSRLSTRKITIESYVISNIDSIARKLIAKFLGYSEGSRKTIQGRLWPQTKPVAHAAAAFIWTEVMDRPQSWHDEHPLLAKDAVLATLFYPDMLKSIIRVSEGLRVRLPDLKLRIRDEDVIRFAIT